MVKESSTSLSQKKHDWLPVQPAELKSTFVLTMNNRKLVLVSASFDKGKDFFTWLKKYAKESDAQFLYWDEFAFTTEHLSECDAVLVFNNPSEKIETLCFPENVIAFMMEPGIYSENPWMLKGLQQYAAVYSPVQNSSNTILSHGFLGWHVLQDWNQLSRLAVPEKKMTMSCIASKLQQFKGHRRRVNFIETLQKEIPSIDFFGKGRQYIPDKMDGLLPYRFSIAIENTSAPYYFTEKITDCFLAYTVPVYYGCKNINSFFPEKSFIWIDIERPQQAIEKIRQIIENYDWQERIGALQEARNLVLNKYQPLAAAAGIFRQVQPSLKRPVQLRPVPDSLLRKAKNLVNEVRGKK